MATHHFSPEYIYTARTSDLKGRNRWWSRLGMLKYNKLYKKVEEDCVADNGASVHIHDALGREDQEQEVVNSKV
jgi:hypothetical protein